MYKVYYQKTFTGRVESDFSYIPGQTHIFIRRVEAASREEVYRQMQGFVWSPNGEARPIIESVGVFHTSMSVGDVAVNRWGRAWVCANRGWQEVFPPTPAGRFWKAVSWTRKTFQIVKEREL